VAQRGVEVYLCSSKTSALEGGEWSAARPGRILPPGKEPVPVVQEDGWAPGPVWTGRKSCPPPTGIRSPFVVITGIEELSNCQGFVTKHFKFKNSSKLTRSAFCNCNNGSERVYIVGLRAAFFRPLVWNIRKECLKLNPKPKRVQWRQAVHVMEHFLYLINNFGVHCHYIMIHRSLIPWNSASVGCSWRRPYVQFVLRSVIVIVIVNTDQRTGDKRWASQ
jgi:hypothetical protein